MIVSTCVESVSFVTRRRGLYEPYSWERKEEAVSSIKVESLDREVPVKPL